MRQARRAIIETQSIGTFPGGIHPPEYKDLTQDRPIEVVPHPKLVAILLSQHTGAICKPLVNKRDRVTAGQMIGKADA